MDEKDFERIPSSVGDETNDNEPLSKPKQPDVDDAKDWKFYDGDLNEYYSKLERDEHAKQDLTKMHHSSPSTDRT